METRAWVFDALLAVVLKGTYSNLYVKEHLDELPEQQRAMASRMFYGTIQNWDLCAYVWQAYARDNSKTSDKVAVLLNLAVYQILFVKKVPPYAAVDEMVSLARKRFGPQAAGFVNATLRAVLNGKVKLPQDETEKLALRWSLPVWLVKMWQAQYGKERARQMAESVNAALPVYVRPNLTRIREEEFYADDKISHGPNGLGIFSGGSPASHPFYLQGKMSMQDPGSKEIADFMQAAAGETVLDVCAAPGTKSMAMAEAMNNEGRVDAIDLHAHRARLISQDARRLHLTHTVKAHTGDARDLQEFGLYDKVLCDVPCSGYGVLARKPDLKLKIKSEDMDSLIPLQQEILASAAGHVKPNGTIVYSTCTLNKKENEKQVEKFLASHPQFELEEEKTVFPDKTHNGFYMARLKRLAV